jgi:phospholipase C
VRFYASPKSLAGIPETLFPPDNFDDNALAWFNYWQKLPAGVEKQKGLGFLGLQDFYDQAGNGTLPQVSIIVGPTELSEHPDNTPLAVKHNSLEYVLMYPQCNNMYFIGAWLQQEVVNAVMHSPLWNETALIINYDESGGKFKISIVLQIRFEKCN